MMILALLLATSTPLERYQAHESMRLVPLLQEALRFPTISGDAKALADQQAWLKATALALGLQFFDEGPVSRIVLPGPSPDAPRLGLLVHGDVQPVEGQSWSHPPFAGVVEGGIIFGRGSADDKGPMVQALLAMSALSNAGPPRTHSIELLVGSDEESGNLDMKTWLAAHRPPDYSLVLDLAFPVIVGEKAWNGLAVTAQPGARAPEKPWSVESLEAGLAGSIVPDQARLVLRWGDGTPDWRQLKLGGLPAGTRLKRLDGGRLCTLVVQGKSAHSGVNIEGGRNALVALARAVEGQLPGGQADDLLSFARFAGADLHGQALGLPPPDELWGGLTVNVATIKPPAKIFGGTEGSGALQLLINIRSTPALSGPELQKRMEAVVAAFNQRTGAKLEASGYYGDTPLQLDPNGKLARRLLAAYERATGEKAKPGVSGGGSYAKRFPNSIGFGMWFTDLPYPGHDADEKVPIEKLHKGVRVLLEALGDLASGPKLQEPLTP